MNSDVLERILLGVRPDIASGLEGKNQEGTGARITRHREEGHDNNVSERAPTEVRRQSYKRPRDFQACPRDRANSGGWCHDVAVLRAIVVADGGFTVLKTR